MPDDGSDHIFVDWRKKRSISSMFDNIQKYSFSKFNKYKAYIFGKLTPPSYVGNCMRRKIWDTIFKFDNFNAETAEHSRIVSEQHFQVRVKSVVAEEYRCLTRRYRDLCEKEEIPEPVEWLEMIKFHHFTEFRQIAEVYDLQINNISH
jgi:hypothetical protein